MKTDGPFSFNRGLKQGDTFKFDDESIRVSAVFGGGDTFRISQDKTIGDGTRLDMSVSRYASKPEE